MELIHLISISNWIQLLSLSFLAALIAAVAGFGGSVILLPLTVHLFGIKAAVPILTVAQLMGNASRVWLGRRDLDWKVIAFFALGCVPSCIVGAIMFGTMDAVWLKRGWGFY
ncbi:putative membrane protein [hydrocarbon metagenome]|uniref:Putative membrane protein n=1 Tax=hydrocarbon metagenome TaxID=938273 RepID=A0A0W8E1Y1_9ZZZZ